MDSEIKLRLLSFFLILVLVSIIEYIRPKRQLKANKSRRWMNNFSLVVVSSFAAKIIVPFTAASTAVYAQEQGLGLFNTMLLPNYLVFVLALVLLDLIIYIQHVAFHHIPWLWRLHKVHHIDQDIDVSTGVRFHPIEIILSVLIKCSAVLLLGIPVLAVIVFEILLNATAMFNHGNIRLPYKVDKYLRWVLVTPDMHRVHHSVIVKETNSNFGFNLPWWDRVFKTYKPQPENGHLHMQIGLKAYQDELKMNPGKLLLIPLQGNKK